MKKPIEVAIFEDNTLTYTTIENEYYSLRRAISYSDNDHTLIEHVSFIDYLDKEKIIICVDEEGLIKQLPLTLVITHENQIVSGLCGKVMFLRDSGENYGSLTPKQKRIIEVVLKTALSAIINNKLVKAIPYAYEEMSSDRKALFKNALKGV